MSGTPSVMRIGEVHAQLRRDFPDVELSKIRYYEDKGLVQPSRSRKGYRLYSDRDVACLREAIRLAQDEFVPLRVVRLRLIEQGLLEGPPVSASSRQAAREASASVITAPAPVRAPLRVVESDGSESNAPETFFTAAELMASADLSPEAFNAIRALGFVRATSLDGEALYDELDVRVATSAKALLARGVDPRILGSLRRVAEREVAVVDDLTGPLRRGATAETLQATVLAVAFEVSALRQLLLERELTKFLDR